MCLYLACESKRPSVDVNACTGSILQHSTLHWLHSLGAEDLGVTTT